MNVKAGDLAIITDTPMKGLIVEVIEQSKEFLPHIAWKVRAIGGAVRWTNWGGEVWVASEAYVLDALLRPLPGDREIVENEVEVTV